MTNINNTTNPIGPANPTAPDITTPGTQPDVGPRPRRYEPEPDHCPGQRVRTVRRVRRIIEP